MNISEIFGSSFKYQLDIKICNIQYCCCFTSLNVSNNITVQVLQIILNVVSFVAQLFYLGYGLDIYEICF